jgi:hypothetical protein
MALRNHSQGRKLQCASSHVIVSGYSVPQMRDLRRADILSHFECPTTNQMRYTVNACGSSPNSQCGSKAITMSTKHVRAVNIAFMDQMAPPAGFYDFYFCSDNRLWPGPANDRGELHGRATVTAGSPSGRLPKGPGRRS